LTTTPMNFTDPVWRAASREGQEQAAQWEAECVRGEILAEWGHEGWLAHCRQERAADTERPLARVVSILAMEGARKPRGTLREPERARLLADKPLAAYWDSVGAGEDGWAEEQIRIRDRQRLAMRAPAGTEERMNGVEMNAIKALLPIWRAWGQMLIDAGVVGDLGNAFLPPDW